MKNYKEAYQIIRAAKMQGETNEQAFTRAGVSETTFYRWKQERKGFAQMLADTERMHNLTKARESEIALHRAATGYEYTEVRTEYAVGAHGQPIITKQVKTTKHIPPNVQAVKMELLNLNPAKWSNTPLDDTPTGIRVEVVTKHPEKTK